MTHTEPAAPARYTNTVTGETFEMVNTHALRPGDLILDYGMRLRLGERHVGSYHADAVWFTGTVENIDEIRAMGRDHVTYGILRADGTWTVQGNELANWHRIVGA